MHHVMRSHLGILCRSATSVCGLTTTNLSTALASVFVRALVHVMLQFVALDCRSEIELNGTRRNFLFELMLNPAGT